MYYTMNTDKSFEQAVDDLDKSVKAHEFGVLHVHDLGSTLRSKGIGFEHECKVFEVCSPRQAAEVLDFDMSLNMALPCRISVWRKDGQTRIGMIRPAWLLEQLNDEPRLQDLAAEVEQATMAMIDEAGATA
ncbi:MAG TPA: DUF302 domain-containing protein [Woeseiaceae bacterium]|nr:DUF302 domain-containing protein [Woeseiaceae bacterium]